MNNITHGIVFKDDNDDVWMGEYENGSIAAFNPLTDFENVYEDLTSVKFMFVEIEEGSNEQVLINDLCSFEVGRESESLEGEETKPMAVEDVLKQMQFPSEETDSLFASFYSDMNKGN